MDPAIDRSSVSTVRNSTSTLNFVAFYPASVKVGLSIYEAETYDAAVPVQQAIGNLVYYSNFGRYEPRVAKSWTHPSPHLWQFELHNGFKCENGEAITAESFRESLLRSIKNQERRGGSLVFRELKGFSAFISGKSDLVGIQAENSTLTFEFNKPVRDGLLESLSYAPYGYLCAANFNSDGSWKDNLKLISSGPYRVESIEIGKKVVLVRRDDWMGPFAEGAPEMVNVTYDSPGEIDPTQNWILDINRQKPIDLDQRLLHYPMVPEYLSLMVLGNLKTGFFSRKENRLAFKERFEYRRAKDIPLSGELWTRADAFYANQDPTKKPVLVDHPLEFKHRFSHLTSPIIIFGKPPVTGASDSIFVELVMNVLKDAGLEYRFSGASNTFEAISDTSVDIRRMSISVGGEVRPWTIRVIFCSPLSYSMPDPSGKICKMVDDYDKGSISLEEVTKMFLDTVEDDAAILPVRHFGQHMYLTKSIDQESFGPSFSILRFDQLRMFK